MAVDSTRVAVVICAYTENRWNELVASVASVRAQTTPPGQIVVVVDHNPALLSRAREYFRDVTVVENGEARGLGGARNSGVRASRGDVVAFLDDDAVAEPEWLENLLLDYRDPNVMGVGGATLPQWQGERPAWFPEEFGWVVGCSYRGQPESRAAVRNLHGCNMSFRRQVFDSIGGFRLGYGCDETEFCIRLQQKMAGKQVVYEPAARIKHLVTRERATLKYFLTRCHFEGGSKAVVSWIAGSRDGLASERSYTFQTLPRGIVLGLRDALAGAGAAGLARAVVIIMGLGATTLGYVRGKFSTGAAARKRGWYDREGGRAASGAASE
ncbi:MAG: glycosyltransferase family 2 protein [Rudaea sp.]